MPINYADGVTAVQIGDRVQVRIFLFLKKFGRVVYVPGISASHPEMEHDGIKLVGINFETGGSGGFWADLTTGNLIQTVRFIVRDSSPVGMLPPENGWK